MHTWKRAPRAAGDAFLLRDVMDPALPALVVAPVLLRLAELIRNLLG